MSEPIKINLDKYKQHKEPPQPQPKPKEQPLTEQQRRFAQDAKER